ncbi:hypothetical protein Tco_0941239 [Tanacetum coccineum]|uniref:Uncharacterized protein n=1 Tax=Tanacetum coccineum TaxID=301880 RepID=A0ABQ5DR94_9ASTR
MSAQPVATTTPVEKADAAKIPASGSEKSTPLYLWRGRRATYTVPTGVALGSQLRLIFEQEAKLFQKAQDKIDRQDQRILVRDAEIERLNKELRTVWAAAAEAPGLRDQVTSLKSQLETEKKLDAAFEAFKKQEEEKLVRRVAELDDRLDKLNIDFDEELYPHMLTAIVGRRWMISHDTRLAVMKCAESVELRQKFAEVVSTGMAKGYNDGILYGLSKGYDSEAEMAAAEMEGYDPEANDNLTKALEELKNMSYPFAPLELKIPVYQEVRDPRNPWEIKEEILLEDTIVANVSPTEKKKCRVVCCSHGVGFAHHARSDGVPVSVPTVPLQGLAQLLSISTQTPEDGYPVLRRTNSLPHHFQL